MAITNLDYKYRLKRIIYQSTHRGCKELDIILGNFVNAEVTLQDQKIKNIYTLTQNELDLYEGLCNENEWDIYGWVTGEIKTPQKFAPIIFKIIDFNTAHPVV